MKNTSFPIRYLLVVVTFLMTVLLYIDRACISAAKDSISNDLNLDATEFGWIMAVFTLGYALFQTPSGRFADKYEPRIALTAIVSVWSLLTAVTGGAWNYVSMLVIRFLFGAGEAGAFPGLSKVVYNWFPVSERGIVQGINFSGSRLGAAFALPLVSILINALGWRLAFVFFGLVGVVFAVIWYKAFRDRPEDHPYVSAKEKDFIITNRSSNFGQKAVGLSSNDLFASSGVWLASIQYICSNFTFYFTLSWMYPYIKETYALGNIEAGLYSAIPLIAGAFGNWTSGYMVDALYKRKSLKSSRQIPAITGFALAIIGMLMVSQQTSALGSVIFLSLAVYGADMTLSPSWAYCIDIGKENSATVSATMNMAGNLGAFATILLFPYLLQWTNSYTPFFVLAASLGILAIIMWLFMNPNNTIKTTNS